MIGYLLPELTNIFHMARGGAWSYESMANFISVLFECYFIITALVLNVLFEIKCYKSVLIFGLEWNIVVLKYCYCSAASKMLQFVVILVFTFLRLPDRRTAVVNRTSSCRRENDYKTQKYLEGMRSANKYLHDVIYVVVLSIYFCTQLLTDILW